MTVPDTEIAWAAGFFDGEGWIGAQPKDPSSRWVRLSMTVVHTGPEDRPPAALERFQAAVGGVGHIYGRGPSDRLGDKPIWSWSCEKLPDVRDIVALLLPFLTVKVDQVATAIARRNEYEGLRADLKRFCKRGHDMADAYVIRRKDGTDRRCRPCRLEAAARYRAREA
jgi:hypothetical protein